MRIAIMVEGETERAFMPILRSFLKPRLKQMPRLDSVPQSGRLPKEEKLKRIVDRLLSGPKAADLVIALTDVYTGTREFTDAEDAKQKMRAWVGQEPRFHPHAAQHDFEAWLLPHWPRIQRLAKHSMAAPAGHPETVNHDRPPAHRLIELFEAGKCRRSYSKVRDTPRILENRSLQISIDACPELKSFVNTILAASGGEIIR